MNKKGIMLSHSNRVNWIAPIYTEYEKYVHLIDVESSLDTIINIIKEKEICYVIIPVMQNIIKRDILKSKVLDIKKHDIEIITFVANPPGEILGNQLFKKFFNDIEPDGLITHNHCAIDLFEEWLGMNINIFYHKWGIPLDVFKDYGLEKTIDVSSSGKFSAYPFRRELDFLLCSHQNMKYVRFRQNENEQIHPNYAYAKKLNESWISIGGCSMLPQFMYYNNRLICDTFPKNLEIAGSKSCLLTTDWGDREYLGFEDGENCILFKTLKEAIQKIEYYLNNKKLLSIITNNGYELVQKNHDIVDTIKSIFKDIENTYAT